MVEHIRAIPIESDVAVLKREAQAAHREWFAAPESAYRKARYASALLRWGREAHKRNAIRHAENLLTECKEAKANV